MTSPKWIWGLAIGALAAAGLSMLLVKKEPPAPDEQPPRITATAAPIALDPSPTPIMMAAAEPTTAASPEPTNTPAAETESESKTTATPVLGPPPLETDPAIIAEKLKELTTYRNEELGFEFQYPTYYLYPQTGALRPVSMQRIETPWDLLNLRSYSLRLEFSVTDESAEIIFDERSHDLSILSDLRAYLEYIDAEFDQENHLETHRVYTDIWIDGTQGVLCELSVRGKPESSINVVTGGMGFFFSFPGHLSRTPDNAIEQAQMQRIRQLLDSWTFLRRTNK